MEKFKVDSKTEIIFNNNDWDVIENGVSQTSIPKSLYKFFSLNDFSLDGLENNYVYLSNPKDFNDPFDCNRNLILEKQKKLRNWQYVETLNDLSDIGIACLSENGMEPLLWSHYANSYRGFSIKFNLESLIKKQKELVKIKKVIYSELPMPISQNLQFADYYQYFLKLNNWSYEKEWRLLFQNPSTTNNKFYFDKSCIEEISVGYKFNDTRNDEERELKKLFDKLKKEKFNDVPLMTVGPHQIKLELNKMLLKEGTYEDAKEMIKNNFGFLIK